jgi:hypothetical protein
MKSEVRPYTPRDRPLIEDIGYRTGFMGESSEAFWRHRKSSAAIWIAPYVDTAGEFAPEVGRPEFDTVDGNVVGYLTGCVDPERFKGSDTVMMRNIWWYGLLYRPGVAGFLWRAMLDRVRDRRRGHKAISGELHDPRWPSHLHLNLLPEARGRGLGRFHFGGVSFWWSRIAHLSGFSPR